MNPVESYLNHIAGVRRYSQHTVDSYRRDISRLVRFLGAGEEEFAPSAVSDADIDAWIISLSHEGLATSSINRMISACNSMFKYFMHEGLVTANPFRKTRQLKTPANLPAFVPESRMRNIAADLAAEVDDGGDFRTCRDALVVLFLYSTGIRLAELIDIDRTDFSRSYSELTVRGKGGKERVVPILPELQHLLQRYLAAIKSGNICKYGEKALFLTEKGERISRSEVYRIVHSRLAMAGMAGKLSPHVLRHTFATHMMDSGADLREIQELLGHASLNATQVYTHNSIAQLKEIYAKAHPHAAHEDDDAAPGRGPGKGDRR